MCCVLLCVCVATTTTGRWFGMKIAKAANYGELCTLPRRVCSYVCFPVAAPCLRPPNTAAPQRPSPGMHSPGPIYDPPSDFSSKRHTKATPARVPDRFNGGHVARSSSPGPIYALPKFGTGLTPISFGSGPRFPPHSACDTLVLPPCVARLVWYFIVLCATSLD